MVLVAYYYPASMKNNPTGVVTYETADHVTSNFLKTVSHKFHLVHSWILCPIYDVGGTNKT